MEMIREMAAGIIRAVSARHGAVALLLVAVLLGGKNFGGTKTISQESYQNELEEMAYVSSTEASVTVLDRERSRYLLGDLFGKAEGTYRLTYEVRALLPAAAKSKDDVRPQPQVDLLVREDTKEGSGGIILRNPVIDSSYEVQEGTFSLTSATKGLEFSVENMPIGGKLYLKDMRVTEVGGPGTQSTDYVYAMGSDRLVDALVPQGHAADANRGTALWRSGQMVGQVFRAESESLAEVELKLKRRGNGGSGTYRLELRKVTVAEDRYLVQDAVLAKMDFRADQSWKYAESYAQDALWRFPLAAFLVPGDYYYVGISNDHAKFNWWNGISAYGFAEGNLPARGIRNGSQYDVGGQLYLRIRTLEGASQSGNGLLNGSVVSGKKGGAGSFAFSLKREPQDLLSLDRSAMIAQEGKGGVTYDGLRKSLVAAPSAGYELLYKIPTLYPAQRIYVDAEELGDGHDCVVSISTDGKQWREVKRTSARTQDEDNFFEDAVDGNGTTTIWVKVVASAGSGEGLAPIFGLPILSIQADLTVTP